MGKVSWMGLCFLLQALLLQQVHVGLAGLRYASKRR